MTTSELHGGGRLLPAAAFLALLLPPSARGAGPPPDTLRTASGLELEVLAMELKAPWDMEFAPDGRIFVTERPGRIRVVEDGRLRDGPWARMRLARAPFAEAGLMGLAVDPDFERNGRVYVCHSYYRNEQGLIGTRVVAYREVGDGARGEEREVILDEIPGALFHDGCRLEFGPDDRLYVTTGDARLEPRAQKLESLAGKILRVETDGSVPDDNPFHDSPVWSLGHRNAQGLAFEPGTGRLLATEHGSGGVDELNLIRPGGNYGWPWHNGDAGDPRFTDPILEHASPPAGATFVSGGRYPGWDGSLLFAGLGRQHLFRVELDGASPPSVTATERLLEGEVGRLRDVEQGPDGLLYLITSNRDGRGRPREGDDRLLRILPP